MTVNKIIRELLSMPKRQRMIEFDFGRKVRMRTKDGHEITITFNEFFASPNAEQETTARNLGTEEKLITKDMP